MLPAAPPTNFDWSSEVSETHWVRGSDSATLDLYVELQASIRHVVCDVGCTQHCACQLQLKQVAERAFKAENAQAFF